MVTIFFILLLLLLELILNTNIVGKRVGKVSRKVGGLCPANIKLNFNIQKNNFTVHFCVTHVGHQLDNDNNNHSNR